MEKQTFKDYYAAVQFFISGNHGSSTLPSRHRYILLKGFDEQTLQMVNEQSLRGEWNLICGKRERLDFIRHSISNGPELGDFSPYTGQVYKRIPQKKTFLITLQEFRERLFGG